jgi:Transposase IS116/IS110/IS902 family
VRGGREQPKLSAKVRVLSSFAGNARKRTTAWRRHLHRAGRPTKRSAGLRPTRGRPGGPRRDPEAAHRKTGGPGGRAHPLFEPPARSAAGPPLRSCQQAALRRCRRQVVAPRQATAWKAGRVRRPLASELVRDVRARDRRIAELDERIAVEVEASGTTLTEVFGVGPILAAKIVGIVGNVGRFPSKAHYFASYAGVAPIEASSGEVVRHRLSLAVNRRLNQLMHMRSRSARSAAIPAAGRTIGRSWRRASRAGRRCAASSDASRMPCSGRSSRIRRALLWHRLDTEGL